ncbi:MAG: serine hydrolase [Planctomycetaceae bacterium]|nr:serine hydrolase [Planctomycetaceae bacterium]
MSRRHFTKCLAGAAATLIAQHRYSVSDEKRPPEEAHSKMPQVNGDGAIFFPDMHRSDVMKGFPPPEDQRVTLENWAYSSTGHWRWTHLNPDRVFKSIQIERGAGPVWQLPREMIAPDRLLQAEVLWGNAASEARKIPLPEWLERADIDALVALRDGRIVAEIYTGKMTPRTRHIIWCASKSFLSTLLAPLIASGRLDEHAELTRYVPELSKTAFSGATIRQCLDQTTGILAQEWLDGTQLAKLDEAGKRQWDWGSPEFKRAQHALARNSRASGLFPWLDTDPFVGYYDFLFTLHEQEYPHGRQFNYKDSNSMALQLTLERTTGISYLEHASNLISEIGFEANAGVMLDPAATPVGAFGMTMTARDFARWGQMVCARGRVGRDKVLPGQRELVDQMVSDLGPERLEGVWDPGSWPNLGYKSLFWNSATHRGRNPVFHAAGAWGQKCLIDPAAGVVVVQLGSSWDHDPDRIADNEVGNHAEVALWSFMQDVVPTLVG